MSEAPKRDEVTGIETTGHEWDGITELDNPLPRWWLWVFYATIAGSIAIWIVYPSWPVWLGEWTYTRGVADYSKRRAVAEEIEQVRQERQVYLDQIEAKSLTEIRADANLLNIALHGGAAAFGDNCAPCHGSGAQGFTGYPNLNDDAWLWGGSLEDIRHTIAHGIRWEADPDTRYSVMQPFLRDGILSRSETYDVTQYVLSLSERAEDAAAAERGAETFETICSACHAPDGKGSYAFGAPDLTDAIWLYGGDEASVFESIAKGRAGVMPSWTGRLDAATIKQLAIYVHSLGGGEEPAKAGAQP